MNEYEAATLAFRTATLAAQETGLKVAMAQVAATLAIGAGQIAIVWYGIRAMRQAGEARATEQDQRHTEAMQRLDQQRQALESLIDGQREQGAALAALLRRQGDAA